MSGKEEADHFISLLGRVLPKLPPPFPFFRTVPQESKAGPQASLRNLSPESQALLEAKVAEWESRGYPPGLIRKARQMAIEGTLNWSSYLSRFASSVDEEAVARHYIEKVAENWVRSFT